MSLFFCFLDLVFYLFQLKIKPYHYAVFRLNLTAPDHEGMFATDMLITTQFEDIWIPIAVRTADGSLIAIPESLHFDKMYPVSIREYLYICVILFWGKVIYIYQVFMLKFFIFPDKCFLCQEILFAGTDRITETRI